MTTSGTPAEANSLSTADLEHVLARCDIDLVSSERIDDGVNTLFAVDTGPDDQSVVVKAFTCSDAPGDAMTEALLYEHVGAHTSIPVPAVIATEPSSSRGPPWIVLQKVSGENVDGDVDRLPLEVLDRLYSDAGAYLGELHATFELESFGDLAMDGDTLTSAGAGSTWADVFDAVLAPRLAGISSGQFSAVRPEVERVLGRTRHVLNDVDRPTVVHDDYRLGNMLVDPRDPDTPLTAILDWESAFVGHHEYDLARAEYMMIDQQFGGADNEPRRERLRTRLYDGYREHHSAAEDERFETRRHVYRAASVLLLMWAFPVVWDGRSSARRAREAAVLEQHLRTALDAAERSVRPDR